MADARQVTVVVIYRDAQVGAGVLDVAMAMTESVYPHVFIR